MSQNYKLRQQKVIYIEDTSQQTYEQYIFPQFQAQLILEEQDGQLNNQNFEIDKIQPYLNEQQTNHQVNSQFMQLPSDLDPFIYNSNYAAKRPATAIASWERKRSSLRPSSSISNQIQKNNFPHLSPSQKSASTRNLTIQQLNSLSRQNLALSNENKHRKLNIIPNIVKKTSNKQGIRPKTALEKGLNSPNHAQMVFSPTHYFEPIKPNVASNIMVPQFPNANWQSNDGRRYERNVKTFATPMFIKGKQVKPLKHNDQAQFQFPHQ